MVCFFDISNESASIIVLHKHYLECSLESLVRYIADTTYSYKRNGIIL